VKKTRAICRVVHTGATGCTRRKLRGAADASGSLLDAQRQE
jgi:hypothetical protein